jgi:hypothetical protein
MVETYDIRLFSKYLSLVSDKKPVPRKVPQIATVLRGVVGDPLYVRVGELDQRLRKSGLGAAFAFWRIQRRYSEEELARAELFLLRVPFTEASAEEYGTHYEESPECQPEIGVLEHVGGTDFRIVRRKVLCALGSKQVGPVRIAFRELRKNLDIYRLWSGELVVSERFVNLTNREGFSGGTFFPISDARDDYLTSPLEFLDSPVGLEVLSIAADKQIGPGDWSFWQWLNRDEQRPLLERMLALKKSDVNSDETTSSRRNLAQLVLRSKPLGESQHSRFGATPFDTDREGRHECAAGVIAGRRLITRLSIIRSSWDGSDLCRTNVYVGGQRQGLFRPHQLLVVSKRVLEALQHHGMKGFQFEVAEMI